MESTPIKVVLKIKPNESDSTETFFKIKNKTEFDAIISQKSSFSEFYGASIKNLVEKLFKGINCSILTYGQTGSGKTFTMGSSKESLQHLNSQKRRSNANFQKSQENHGVISQVLIDLFGLIELEKKQNNCVSLKVSFVEIYLEKIIDLLSLKRRKNDDEEKTLRIRDCNGKIMIKDLSEIEVDSLTSLVKLLQRGFSKRSVGTTSMNAQSSRSHAIITFNLEIKKSNSNQTVKSKINLIDLAGSECQKKSKTFGAGFDEAKEINYSLNQLGIVIKELANKKKAVSYRDSKLTHLLKDSLGGNSMTLVIACISSDQSDKKESSNTIQYAQFARTIENKVSINIELEETRSNKNNTILNTEIDKMRLVVPDSNQTNLNAFNDKLNQLLEIIMAQDAQINQLVNDKKKLNKKFNKQNEFDDSNKIARPKIIIEDDSIIVIEADDLKTKIVSSEINKSKCHICGKLTKNLHKHLIYHKQIKKYRPA